MRGVKPFHADQLEITAEVPGVESTYWQAIAEAGHGGLEVGFVEVRIKAGGLVDGGIHVCPHQRDCGSWDPASFIGYLDRDVLFPFRDDDFGYWEGLLFLPMCLHHSSEGVLESLKEHVRQMARDIHEVQVVTADQPDFGGVEKAIVILADKSGVLDSFLCQFLHVRFRADYANIARVSRVGLIRQRNVLPDKHSYAYPRHVESI